MRYNFYIFIVKRDKRVYKEDVDLILYFIVLYIDFLRVNNIYL